MPLLLAAATLGCGDAVHRPIPSGAPQPRVGPTPAVAPAPGPGGRESEPFEALVASGRSPVVLSASAVEGFPPLPTYRATVRNLSDRSVLRVIATVVYLDASGAPIPGEERDVALGNPRSPVPPAGTLETSFLSRVDRAPAVRLVVRTLELGPKEGAGSAAPVEWTNPRREEELATARGR